MQLRSKYGQSCNKPEEQKGAALAVSMILLIALTMLGVTTLSGTRLNEKSVSNDHQKAIAFETIESSIMSIWNAGYLRGTIVSSTGARNDPDPIDIPESKSKISTDFDQLDAKGKGTDIDGRLTIQYCGETIPNGTSFNADESQPTFVGMLIDIRGEATINKTNTSSVHVQRASITVPKTGRTGNCQ